MRNDVRGRPGSGHGADTRRPEGLACDGDSVLQEKSHDFSLVLGGPIFQLLRKLHLSREELGLLHRRLLSITASSGSARVSLFQDVEVHGRFLVALPVLIVAELRIRPVVKTFVERRIVLIFWAGPKRRIVWSESSG